MKRVLCSNHYMNTQKISERFWSKVEVLEGSKCWAWNGAKDRFGYGQFRMIGRTIRAPRVAFWLRFGKWPDNACHSCDNPICCNPDHLFNGSRFDNMSDMAKKGRCNPCRGESHYSSVLTDEKVISMRKEYKLGKISMLSLSEKYGCSFSTAQRVIKRKNWKHLP